MQCYTYTNFFSGTVQCMGGGCFLSSGSLGHCKRLGQITKWVSGYIFQASEKANQTIGELEETMLLSFCAGSKVKVILQHPDAVTIVKCAGAILQKSWETQGNASFDVDISLLHKISVKTHRADLDTQNTTEQTTIPADIMDMLVAGEIIG